MRRRLRIRLNRRDLNRLPKREADSGSGNVGAVGRLGWARMRRKLTLHRESEELPHIRDRSRYGPPPLSESNDFGCPTLAPCFRCRVGLPTFDFASCSASRQGRTAPPSGFAGRVEHPASIHFGIPHLEYTEEGGKSYIARAGGISQRGGVTHFGMAGFSEGTAGNYPTSFQRRDGTWGTNLAGGILRRGRGRRQLHIRQKRADMGTVAYSQLPHLPKAGRYGAPSGCAAPRESHIC
jgi:hypothetical protein